LQVVASCCRLIIIKFNMSNIPATISVLQPISDVTAITCGARHAQRSQAGPSRRLNMAVQAVRFGGLTWNPNIAVARRACLWDISNKIYINQDAEKAAIRKIAEKMDIDIDYVSFFSDSSAATRLQQRSSQQQPPRYHPFEFSSYFNFVKTKCVTWIDQYVLACSVHGLGVTTVHSVIDSWRSRPPASLAWKCCSCTDGCIKINWWLDVIK